MRYGSWSQWSAIHDIDRRLAALEENARQMDEIDARKTVLKDLEKRVSRGQREPGWYWVKWEADNEWLPVRHYGDHWHSSIPPKIIGPRIQEPGE